MIAPKLVASGRHSNIELITYADLEEVGGKAGNFKVKILRHPRYIDVNKCTGCGECEAVCPVEADSEFELGLGKRHAIYRMYPQAMPGAFAIDKKGISPCRDACPAGVKAQAYVALMSQGKFREALEVIRETLPFPSVCGRVCHHPCEEACNRKDVDEPVAVRQLKRFAVDWAREHGEDPPERIEPSREEKVAVIGAGPAGLTCALRLLQKGYPVTVFEASDKPGGMLLSCLPDYRLPKDAAQYDIDRVLAHGIELKTNVGIGKDITLEQLRNKYKAVFVAIGAQNAAKLPIEGVDVKGVLYGIDFLRAAKGRKTGDKPEEFGKNVVVIGGGNVAIDCANSALRLGAESVKVVCLETRDLTSKDRMPAHDWEIEDAEEEGVQMHGYLGPNRVLSEEGWATGVTTKVCTSVYNEQGKFEPVFSGEDGTTFEADTVIIAIGQRAQVDGFDEIEKYRGGIIKTDPLTLETNIPGVFAGGDIARGPASVVEAVAHGNEVAISIARYLNGQDIREGRELKPDVAPLPERKIEKVARAVMPRRLPGERNRDFGEVELGFDEETAVAEAKRCLNCAGCSECLQCVAECKAEAIIHEAVEEITEIDVGSIILSPGFEEFDPTPLSQYGYGRFPNVIISTQFERVLSASGPFAGEVVRPFDRKHPKKIAFLQCVGSRDTTCGGAGVASLESACGTTLNRSAYGTGFCSSVCCTYAIKEAVIAREHSPEVEPTIFFMDMRTYGKGFERYYERARTQHKINFVRAKVSHIEELPDTRNLRLSYETEDGRIKHEEFNLVVLSVGFQPPDSLKQLIEKTGVSVNEYGFCETKEFSPLLTSKKGIFVCGAFSEPKDIPETVMQASGAAAAAGAFLSCARDTMVEEKEYPPEIDVSGQEPRIGVFICHCGTNIGGVVNVPEVVEYAKTLPGVAYAEDNLYTCSQDTQEKIKQTIIDQKLNRVVVASCSPRTHEPLFQDTLREAGLNKYLFEMANIRDQCSWVHKEHPAKATQKAKDLVDGAVAKARLLEPLKQTPIDVTPSALIIGGGLAGITAALTIAEQGFEVALVERQKELGGNLRRVFYTLNGEDPQEHLRGLLRKIHRNKLVHIHANTEVVQVSGFVGNYKTLLCSNGTDTFEVEHGAVIVATGGREYSPDEYEYGQNECVITQQQLEGRIATDDSSLRNKKNVVMIQCVGSRNVEHPYCSRICCSHAIKNALKLKKEYPDAEITILYKDIRTYGFKEEYYLKARQAGVKFIRYEDDNKPELIDTNGDMKVAVLDPVLKRYLIIDTDLLVLSVAIVAQDDAANISEMLKVPLNEDNFFLEAHVKLRPVDFATDGIFMCGLAHSPKSISETISQANAAAGRAVTILSKKQLLADGIVAGRIEELCSGCKLCLSLCPYDAINYNEEKNITEVNGVLCKGCGMCVGACPSGAAYVKGFKDNQIASQIEAILR